MYAVFCNVLPILVDIWTKSSLQPKHEFILHVYSPQKLAENSSMDNYAHPVRLSQDGLTYKRKLVFGKQALGFACLRSMLINRKHVYRCVRNVRIIWLPSHCRSMTNQKAHVMHLVLFWQMKQNGFVSPHLTWACRNSTLFTRSLYRNHLKNRSLCRNHLKNRWGTRSRW